MSRRWKKVIVLLDMDAFFAAVEILDNPQLAHKPVSVTNGLSGSTIITCSYVARRYGIHTGMSLHKARHLCPELINRPARHQRYNQISTAIMRYIATEFTPDIEVFSVDEAFLDMTACQSRFPHMITLAKAIQQGIYKRFSLPASIGVSGDKTTAKYAAKCAKPYGVYVVLPQQAADFLAAVPVTELCGIAHNIAYVLAEYGVHYCQDIKKIPKSTLQQRLWGFVYGICAKEKIRLLYIPKSSGQKPWGTVKYYLLAPDPKSRLYIILCIWQRSLHPGCIKRDIMRVYLLLLCVHHKKTG
jgi:DNA polymerase-4